MSPAEPIVDLQLAHLVPRTAAEGPHERCAIWLQGCSLRCPGCCNPELFDASGGERIAVGALVDRVLAGHRRDPVEGVTVLGGEPLDQLPALAKLCRALQSAGLGVIVFTGHTLAEARRLPGFSSQLWPALDTLVDGRFEAKLREPDPAAGGRRFLGSSNQRLHHRSERYADPELWRGPNLAELRIGPDGALSVHGFPDQARALVKLLGRG